MTVSRRAAALLAVASALMVAASPADAQWMWKDESGRVIASDQAPPVGTPKSRIMKEPRARQAAASTATAPADKDAAPAEPQKSLADREGLKTSPGASTTQRQKESADAAKKADDEAARASAMKENCAAVKSNVVALQSGGRAARFNEKGEKVYIDDADRQSEIAKQQAQVNQYCK